MQWNERGPEFWVGLAVATLYVAVKSEKKSLVVRSAEAAISGGLGFALAPAVAQWAGGSDVIAAILVTALGYIGLDVLTSLLADRALIKEIVLRRLGGGKDGK